MRGNEWIRQRLLGNASTEKLDRIPASVSELYKEELKKKQGGWGWNEITRTILAGTRSDDRCSLALLRDHEGTLVRKITSMITIPYLDHVRLTVPAALFGNDREELMKFTHGRDYPNWQNPDRLKGVSPVSKGQAGGYVSFSRCGLVEFPEPKDRNVNMMPFILGEPTSLPNYLRCYYDLIQACPYVTEEEGKVAFLTVHESWVDVGTSQRRGGLHIESPGNFSDDPNGQSFTPGVEHPWGMGMFFGPDHYEGGIYFASNRSDTSTVWNALVDSSVPGIVDKGGGCEYLRPWLGEGTTLKAGELIWMTDRTPHEGLPQATSGQRQFFRLVMPSVSHWYAEHSTANPKVALPDHVKVIQGNKFERHGITVGSAAKAPPGGDEELSSPKESDPYQKSGIVLSTPDIRTALLDELRQKEEGLRQKEERELARAAARN